MSEPNVPIQPPPPTPPASAGWSSWPPPEIAPQPPTPPRPRTMFSRVLEIVAWIVGITAILFFGRVFRLMAGDVDITPRVAGEIAGSITAALVIGLIASWFFARYVFKGGRAITPWVAVIAVLVLVVNLGNNTSLPVAAPSNPPEHYLAMAAPYQLTTLSAADEQSLGSVSELARNGRYEARRIGLNGEIIGLIIVVDLGVRDVAAALSDLEEDLATEGASGVAQATRDGRTFVDFNAAGVAGSAWFEAPYAIMVYAPDAASAAEIAAAVIAGYE